MCGHQPWVQVGVDDDPPEDCVANHSKDKDPTQPDEVPALLNSEIGGDNGGHEDDKKDHRDQAIRELDQGVKRERRGQSVSITRGPVGAAKS